MTEPDASPGSANTGYTDFESALPKGEGTMAAVFVFSEDGALAQQLLTPALEL